MKIPFNTDRSEETPKFIPARMLNEFAYCPRLCYIEWVQREFCDSADTVDGRYHHRRVDKEKGELPEEKEEYANIHSTSVYLSAPKIGVTTKIDLVEGNKTKVIPVDYKRGRVPDIPEGAYEPERVQVCVQGLVLREKGFDCCEGIIYFVASKKKVSIPFDSELIDRTKRLLQQLRTMACSGKIPPPLQDSPKCPRCSLVSICLPDEVNMLQGKDGKIRRLYPKRDDSIPVYVREYGCSIHKRGNRLRILKEGKELQSIPFREVSQLSIYGNAHLTISTLKELMQRGIPVCYFSFGGWFYGISKGLPHKNVELRIAQYQTASDTSASLKFARSFVKGKIENCRTMLRRNDKEIRKPSLERLSRLAEDAQIARNIQTLLGVEGAAAQMYFSRFNHLIKTGDRFSFENRNKRPPKDPINAVLSYLYGVLVKEWFVTLLTVGFDPYLGFFHSPKYGRPSLALDMMEEFRPLIADSVTLTLFNNGQLKENDFIKTGIGVSLKPQSKKTVIRCYEQRMNTEITHPIFGYQVSYRRILEVQARLLSRVLLGEIESYPPFCTR
ncbi:MAG: CRISPR-associated endonuclease Cas1 [Thermoproteota archaeon]